MMKAPENIFVHPIICGMQIEPRSEQISISTSKDAFNDGIEYVRRDLKAQLATARNDALEGFLAFADAHSEWSQAQFGSDAVRGPEGPLAHLAKEVVEMAEAPNDPMEYADGFMLLLDAARRAGIPASKLLATAWDKLGINKARAWGKPNHDGSVEHVRAMKESTDDKT